MRAQIEKGLVSKKVAESFEVELEKFKVLQQEKNKELYDLIESLLEDMKKQKADAENVISILSNEENEDLTFLIEDVSQMSARMEKIIGLAQECLSGNDKYKEIAQEMKTLKQNTDDILSDPENGYFINKYPKVKGFFENVKQVVNKFMNFITGNKFSCFAPEQKAFLSSSIDHAENFENKIDALNKKFDEPDIDTSDHKPKPQ